MDTVSSWLFQRSATKHLDSVGKDFDSAASNVSDVVTRWWNVTVGKTQMPFTDVLDRFNIPKGVFPKNVSRYNFAPDKDEEDSGFLTVTLPFVCQVKFSDGHVLRYDDRITCRIQQGSLFAISGIKSQGMFWAEVTEIVVKPLSDKIYFQCSMRKTKNAVNYEKPREGVEAMKY